MRFAAQALQGLRGLAGSRVGRAVLPQSGAEWMMSVVPNVAFAGMTAMNQPEGTDNLTRFGTGAEDLAGSLMLQTLGRGFGHGVVGGARRMGAPLGHEMAAGIKGASEMGTELLGYGFVPRPFATSAYDDYEKRMSEQQRDEMAARDEEIRREALVAAGIRGYMFPPGMQLPFLGGGMEGGMV